LTEIKNRLFSDEPLRRDRYTVGMIKILLVEDNVNLRQGIRMRLELEPNFNIVGEAGDGQEALRLACVVRPDVIVMDLRLPALDGLEATQQVNDMALGCKVVILTLYDESANRQRARDVGSAAFVSKREPDDALIRAIRAAAAL
jgi:DNA-binding NarL/FixJ family response regulator